MNLGNIFTRISCDVSSYMTGVGTATKATKTLSLAFTYAGFHAQNLGRAMSAMITTPYMNGVRTAKSAIEDFEEALLNINTIARISRGDLWNLGASISDLAIKTGNSPTGLATAMYDVYSASYTGAEAMGILKMGAIIAKAGISDVGTATKMLTGIMRAYGFESKSLVGVSDVLFKTLERGQFRFNELATHFGETISTASILGLKLDEVGAAVAAITKGGIPAARALTGLNRLLVQLMRGTEGLNAVAHKAGYASSAQMTATLGLYKTLKLLNNTIDGSIDKLVAMNFNIRAQKAAFHVVMGSRFAQEYAIIGDKIQRAGAAMAAFKTQMSGLKAEGAVLKAILSRLAIVFGSDLYMPLRLLNRALFVLFTALVNMPPILRLTLIVFIGLATIVGPVTILIGKLAFAIGALIFMGPILVTIFVTLGQILLVVATSAVIALAIWTSLKFAFYDSKKTLTESIGLLWLLSGVLKVVAVGCSWLVDGFILVTGLVGVFIRALHALVTFNNPFDAIVTGMNNVLDVWEKWDRVRKATISGNGFAEGFNILADSIDLSGLLEGTIGDFEKRITDLVTGVGGGLGGAGGANAVAPFRMGTAEAYKAGVSGTPLERLKVIAEQQLKEQQKSNDFLMQMATLGLGAGFSFPLGI